MTPRMFDLDGEVAAVIGATGALGGAMASGLAAAGARVVVCGRNAARGQERVAAIRAAGGRASFITVDGVDIDSLSRARRAIEDEIGPVTVLVNAAGGNAPGVTVDEKLSFAGIDLAEWRSAFDVNLVGGALLPCQEFGPGMVERRRGSIINIASVAAHVPLSRVVAYSAAKAAVVSLTRFLAREWGRSGVRVNTITPGFFPAEQNQRLLFDAAGAPTDRGRAILEHTPMGRLGTADEIIGAAIFLASPRASSFVTGADIRVDGGFLAQTI